MHDGPPYSHTRSSVRNEELHTQPAPAHQAPPNNNTKRRDRGTVGDGEDAGAKMTETDVVKKRPPAVRVCPENANKDLWAQILKRGEEIYRQASDAQRRDFSLDEIKHVEFLASSILTEVRGMIASDPKTLSSPSLSPSSVDISQTSELEDGPLKKRRGRPPIKKPMCCQQCGTTETPEWRRGESGPNTLCNGCGLRYAKRVKMQEEALNNKGKQKTTRSSHNNLNANNNNTNNNSNGNSHSTTATNQNANTTNNNGSNGTPKGGKSSKNKPKPKPAASVNPPPPDPQSPEPSPTILRPKIEQEEQQLTNSYLYHYRPPYPPDGAPHTSSHPSRPPVEAEPLSIVSESHAPPAWESSLGLSPTPNSRPTSPLLTPPPLPHSPCSPTQPSEYHSSPESHPPHMSPYPMQIHPSSMQGIAHAKGMHIPHHMQMPMHVALPNSLQPSLSPSDPSFSHPKSPYTPRISPYQQYSPYQSPHHFSMTAANLQQISPGMQANLQHSSLPQNIMSNVHAMQILQSSSQEQLAYPQVSAAVRQMQLQKMHQQHLQEALQYQSQQHAQAQQHEQTQQQAHQHAQQHTQTHHSQPAQTQQHVQAQPASPQQQLMQHQLRQEHHQKQQQQLQHLQQQQQQQQQQMHPSMQQMMHTQLYRQIHQYDLPPELQQQQQQQQMSQQSQETLTSPLHNLTPEQFHTLQSLHPSIPVSGYLQELYLQQQQQQHLFHLQLQQQHQQQQQLQIQEQREREQEREQHNHQQP